MRMYNLNCTAIIDYSHIHSIFLMSSITATIFYKFDTGMTTRSTLWAITLSKSAHWEKHYEFVKISLKIWCSQFVCLHVVKQYPASSCRYVEVSSSGCIPWAVLWSPDVWNIVEAHKLLNILDDWSHVR